MTTYRKLDIAKARELCRDGFTACEVADALHVNRNTIYRAVQAGDLACTLTGKPRPKRHKPAPALTIVASQSTDPRTASLINTGGRYADLAAWAQAQGVTEVQARQAWRRLRLPVTKGGAV